MTDCFLLNARRIVLLFFLALAACAPVADAREATPQLGGQLATVPATTAAPAATATPLPPTPTPIGIQTPEPNVAATAAAVGEQVKALSRPERLETHVAPDGHWQAEVVRYDCVEVSGWGRMAYEELRLLDLDTGVAHVADTQLLNCEGLGAFGLGGRFWSPDSGTFYYTTAREGMPDGLCFFWSPPLVALDVASGRRQTLRDGPLSPNGELLAATLPAEGDVVIWNPNRGEVLRVTALVPGAELGPIVWSPGGHALVYLQAEPGCSPQARSWLVRVDMADLAQDVLLESAAQYTAVRWDVPDEITLTSADSIEWRYSLKDGTIQ
jgi:hypothetical protein